MELYGFDVGSRVSLFKEPDPAGVVVQIDVDHDVGGSTTCLVVWGADDLEDAMSRSEDERDIQWSNKLVAVSHPSRDAMTAR